MKSKSNVKYLLLALGISAFVACKKDDTAPKPPDPVPPTLFESISGKWKVNTSVGRVKQNNNVSGKAQDMPHLMVLEFLSDSTYIAQLSGHAYTGKISITDTSVVLPELGTLSAIKVENDKMDLTFAYENEIISTETCTKVADLPSSDKATLLCKNWYITDQENGATFYNDGPDDESFRARALFTKAGSFLITVNYDSQAYVQSYQNWEWSGQGNNFTFLNYEGQENEDVTLEVTELNASSLKFQVTHYQYDGPNDSTLVTDKYVLSSSNFERTIAPRTSASASDLKSFFHKSK